MASTPNRWSPRIQPIALPPLEDGDAAELVAGGSLDGRRFPDARVAEADLTGIVLDGCALLDWVADGAVLDRARLVESVVERLAASSLRAARSTWRDVRMDRTRVGAAEFFDAEWLRVELTASRVDYLNLSGAQLTDVRLEGCTFGDLDLRAARAKRVSFAGCRIGTLSVKDARLEGVDLRGAEIERIDGAANLAGAVIDEGQLTRLAPLFAEALGISVD